MYKKKLTKEKVKESILYLFLSVVSFLLIIGLIKFLYGMGLLNGPHRPKIVYIIWLVPVILLTEALIPWIKFNGLKGEVSSGKIIKLDENGYNLGGGVELSTEDTKQLAHIFDRGAEYLQENFQYGEIAIYLTTSKDEYCFFPDKIDSSLFMTDGPGEIDVIGYGYGFRIHEDESEIVQAILKKYMDEVR